MTRRKLTEAKGTRNAENAPKNPTGWTLDDGMDWGSYVGGTRSRYITRYATFAQQNTDNHSGLEEELANMMNVVQQAGVQQAYGTVLEMADWLWSKGGQFLDLRGHFQDGLQLLTQAVDAARSLGDKSGEERLLGQLGRVWMALENWLLAAEYFEQALTIAREIGDGQGEASHLGNLGQIQLQQRNLQDATNQFQEAIRIARKIGDRQMEGRLWGSLGLVTLRNQMSVGYTREATIEAIEHIKRAIAIAQETGDLRGEASHLGSIGGAYELMGSMNVSLPPFVRGSPYPGEDEARYDRYKTELEQANQKSYLEAYEYYSHALSIAQKIGDEPMQARLHDDRARVAPGAKLPVFPGSGDINMNIWVRNQKPPYTDYVPGTRHEHMDE